MNFNCLVMTFAVDQGQVKSVAIPVKAALKVIGSMALLPGVSVPAIAVGKL